MSSKYIQDNVFHKIIKLEIPTEVVKETKFSLSFYDINPQKNLHILVIPKKLYINVIDFYNNATENEKEDFMNLVLELSSNLPGFQLITNTGTDQLVPHFHVHILSDQKLSDQKS